MSIPTWCVIVVAALPAFAQDPAERFEVSSVERAVSAPNPFTWASGNLVRGARYDFRKATMIDLIHVAYEVDADSIVGGPDWLEFDRFNIAAKTEPNTSRDVLRQRLRNLLQERFGLRVHNDTRPMPAYALARGKGNHLMATADPANTPGCGLGSKPWENGEVVYQCRNVTMDRLASDLHRLAGDYLADPVVNATGIEGAFDFDLRWNRRAFLMPAGARVTIFGAVEKELGLSLAPATAPLPVLVIDKVNENPVPDGPEVALKIPPRPTTFEVADLKLNKSGPGGDSFRTSPAGDLDIRHGMLRTVMGMAWDINTARAGEAFANLPKWVDETWVDIHGKSGAPAGALPNEPAENDDVRLMLKNLIIERFQMKTHIENLPRDVYVLRAVKPKMQKADPSNRAGCRNARTIANDPRDVNPRLASLISCHNVTMAQFALALHPLALDDVIFDFEDETGLKGRFDFTLSFTPRGLMSAPGPEGSADPNGAISLSEAIAKQLGLKLELRKLPRPVTVIDGMTAIPLGN